MKLSKLPATPMVPVDLWERDTTETTAQPNILPQHPNEAAGTCWIFALAILGLVAAGVIVMVAIMMADDKI